MITSSTKLIDMTKQIFYSAESDEVSLWTVKYYLQGLFQDFAKEGTNINPGEAPPAHLK